MRNEPTPFKPLDPGRINSVDPVEMAWWCTQLHCTDMELREALAQVGEHVTEVREVLAGARPQELTRMTA